MVLERRVKQLEQALQPRAEIIVVTSYEGYGGVGWSEPGCETEADVEARVQAAGVGPNDLVLRLQAWGCSRRGTPHSHANGPVQRQARRA